MRNVPRQRRYAAIAAAAVALQALAAVPLSLVAAMPAAGSQAVSQGWVSQIHWKSRRLAPGVTVRSGIVSSRTVAERVRRVDAEIAILLITGWGLRDEEHGRLKTLKIRKCLFKPVRPGELDSAIQDALAPA